MNVCVHEHCSRSGSTLPILHVDVDVGHLSPIPLPTQVLEIVTAKYPWPDAHDPTKVFLDVTAGKRPWQEHGMPAGMVDGMQELVKECSDGEPSKRPSFAQISATMEKLVSVPPGHARPAKAHALLVFRA